MRTPDTHPPPLAELGAPLPTEERDATLARIDSILHDFRGRLDADARFASIEEQLQRLLAQQRQTTSATQRQADAAERQAIAAELAAAEAKKTREEAAQARLDATQADEAQRAEAWARWRRFLTWLLPVAAASAAAARELVRILLLDGA